MFYELRSITSMYTSCRFSCLLFLLIAVGCDSSPGMEAEEETHDGPSFPVAITVSPTQDQKAISPYIYGSNQDLSTADVWTVRRLGGNRLTGYNWENDYSNAGEDWFHTSDDYLLSIMGLTADPTGDPAQVMTTFHDASLAMGAASVITLQMAGYVARDGGGTVTTSDKAPSARWARVEPRKNSAFDAIPDRTDDVVYMDEFIHFMTQRYGNATSSRGVRWYSLDNEPGLWSHTHPRIHPDPVNAAELVARSVELAAAVKGVDPQAQILGPALFGMSAYENLQGAPDWGHVQQGHSWFIDYYLEAMQEAEQDTGIRLLDMLDVHWYPEARGDSRIIAEGAALSPADVSARLQAPRTLWDDTYIEDSWIGQWKTDFLPLLPKLHLAINTYYPGTKLAITEYNYGGGGSISGGLAQADVLGLFGKHEVYLASLWRMEEDNTYLSAAFNLYRNYDGNGAAFGNTSVHAITDDPVNTSVYAAIPDNDTGTLHLILLNKTLDTAAEMAIVIPDGPTYSRADVWSFNAQRATILKENASVSFSGNTIHYRLPAATAVHLILR